MASPPFQIFVQSMPIADARGFSMRFFVVPGIEMPPISAERPLLPTLHRKAVGCQRHRRRRNCDERTGRCSWHRPLDCGNVPDFLSARRHSAGDDSTERSCSVTSFDYLHFEFRCELPARYTFHLRLLSSIRLTSTDPSRNSNLAHYSLCFSYGLYLSTR